MMIEEEYNDIKNKFRNWIDNYDLGLIKANISKVNIHEGFTKGENIVNHLLLSDKLTASQKYDVFKVFIEDEPKMILYKGVSNRKQFSPWVELCGMVGDINSLKELVDVNKFDLIKNLNSSADIIYKGNQLMPEETFNFFSNLLVEDNVVVKIVDLEKQISRGEDAYISYLKSTSKIKNNFDELKSLLKLLLIDGYSDAFHETFKKFEPFMDKNRKRDCFGEVTNGENICLSILTGWLSHGRYPLSRFILLPVLQELDRINSNWLDVEQTQKFLTFQTDFYGFMEPMHNSGVNFLADYLHIDNDDIRAYASVIVNGSAFKSTVFQENSALKNVPNDRIQFDLPVLLFYARDGVECVEYMLSKHPVETKRAISELHRSLDVLELPMRSTRDDINSLFQKFDLEKKILDNNKVGKNNKI